MARRMTHEEYVQKLKEIGTGIEVNEVYRGAKVRVRHTCPICKDTNWMGYPINIVSGESTMCSRCRHETRKIKHEEYVEMALKLGIKVIGTYRDTLTAIRHECPSCGRTDWYPLPSDIIHGKSTKCSKCGNNQLDDKSYSKRLSKLGMKLIGRYINANTKTLHECPICGRQDWEINPASIMYAGVRMCQDCSNKATESAMATILKQVLKHEYPDTIWEYDAGYRGPNGGIGRYDIYIPHLNTLIECQSEYHDEVEQLIIDIQKRKYAIQNGYNFIAIDKRDYNGLEAIQKFFPHIQKIPNYVDRSKNSTATFPLKEVQKMLDCGNTFTAISNKLKVSNTSIRYHIRVGNITVPKTYRHGNSRHMQEVVQLDKNGKVLGIYDLSQILKNKNRVDYHRKIQVARACSSESHYYLGYYWYYKEEFEHTI